MDIQITQVDPATGEVTVALGPISTKKLRGVQKLVQKVAIKILKNYGRDVFNPSDGTDFRNEIGQFAISASGSEDEVRLMVVQRIKKIEADIIDEQGTDLGDPTERLKSIKVVDVAVDAIQASAAVRIRVTNEANEQRDVIV